MKPRLLYVELKTGYNDDGPAWIGKGYFSKTGKTIYFNGLALQGGRIGGIHIERPSRDNYWVSGVKKNATDRHWAGFGKIMIDKEVLAEYLAITGRMKLPKSRYEIIEFKNDIPKDYFNKIENEKSTSHEI